MSVANTNTDGDIVLGLDKANTKVNIEQGLLSVLDAIEKEGKARIKITADTSDIKKNMKDIKESLNKTSKDSEKSAKRLLESQQESLRKRANIVANTIASFGIKNPSILSDLDEIQERIDNFIEDNSKGRNKTRSMFKSLVESVQEARSDIDKIFNTNPTSMDTWLNKISELEKKIQNSKYLSETNKADSRFEENFKRMKAIANSGDVNKTSRKEISDLYANTQSLYNRYKTENADSVSTAKQNNALDKQFKDASSLYETVSKLGLLNEDIRKSFSQMEEAKQNFANTSSQKDLDAYNNSLKEVSQNLQTVYDSYNNLGRIQKLKDANVSSPALDSMIAKLEEYAKLPSNDINRKLFNGEFARANSLLRNLKSGLDLNNRLDSQFKNVSSLYEELGRVGQITDNVRNSFNQIIGVKNKYQETLDTEDLFAYQKALDGVSDSLQNVSKKYNNSISAANYSKKFEDVLSQLRLYRDTYGSGINKVGLGEDFDKLEKKIMNSGFSFNSTGLQSARKELADLQRKTYELGGQAETTSQKLKKMFSAHFGTAAVMYAIHAIQSSLNKVWTSVINIDSAMTELKKVTNETSSTYNKFLDGASVRAKKLGATLTNTISATADAARLGLSVDEASILADSSLIYLNVGDDLEDINKASSSIVGTMKAFNINAEKSISIVDKLNEVSNNHAISSGGLGEGLSNASAALKSAGNSLDESIAMITAITEVTQQPDEAGNAIKVLALRLRGSKTEIEEIGESTDGMAESTAKLRKQIKALTNVNGSGGFDIIGKDGQFKSTYEIMKGISQVWDEIGSNSQDGAALLELIAGKTRSNQAAALLENFAQAEKALKTSMGSEGSAMAENDKRLQSINGKLNILRGTAEGFSNDLLDGNVIKGLVDISTQLLEWADSFQKMGVFLPSVVSALLTMSKIKIFRLNDYQGLSNIFTVRGQNLKYQADNMKNQLTKLQGYYANVTDTTLLEDFRARAINIVTGGSSELTKGVDFDKFVNGAADVSQATQQINDNLKQVQSNAVGFSNRMKLVGKSLKSFGKNLLVGLGNAVLGAAIGMAVGYVFNAIDEYRRKQEQMTEDAAKAAEKLDEETQSLDEYKTKILEIRKALADSNITQDDANTKRGELLTIQDELIEKYGKEADAINNITEALNGEVDALDNVSKTQLNQWVRDNHTAATAGRDYMAKTVEWQSRGDLGYGENASLNSFLDKYSNKLKTDTGIIFDWNNSLAGSQYTLFGSNRTELINRLRQVYEYVQTNSSEFSVSHEEINNILNDLSNVINYWADDNYDQQKANAFKFAEYQIRENYNDVYTELINNTESLKKALKDNDTGSINIAKDKYEHTKNQLISNLSNDASLTDTDKKNIGLFLDDYFQEVQKYIDNYKFILTVDPNNISTVISESAKGKEGAKITADDLLNIYEAGNDNVRKGLGYSDEYLSTYAEIVNAANEAEMSVEDYINSLVTYGYIAKSVADANAKDSFSFLKYSDDISKVQTKVDKLNEAYTKLNSGELTRNEVIELMSEFDDLKDYVDLDTDGFGDLAKGLKEVGKSVPKELLDTLEAIDTDKLSDKDLQSYNALVGYLKDINTEIGKSVDYLDRIQSMISNVSSSISSAKSMLDTLTDVDSSGMLSLSDITTILTDDTYASLRPYINDMDKMKVELENFIKYQKKQYTDLASRDLYEADYESFVDNVKKKMEADDKFIKNTVEDIKDQTKYIEETYDVDLTNWEALSDDKKTVLNNTNAEWLITQQQIIDEIKNAYGIDLSNYKEFSAEKIAVAEATAKQIKRIQDINAISLTMNNGKTGRADWDLMSKSQQQEIGKALKDLGFEANKNGYLKFANTSYDDLWNSYIPMEDIKKIYSIFDSVTISDTDWDKILGKDNNSSSSDKDFEDKIDWIEKRLQELADKTEKSYDKVSKAIGFKSKNSLLNTVISNVGQEISTNQQAYTRYMQEANKAGLSDYYRYAVQNGLIDISKITDENLSKKIEEYQKWYDKAQESLKNIRELTDKQREYQIEKLTNIKTYYDEETKSVQNYISELEKADNIVESKDGIVGKDSYNKQIEQQKKLRNQFNQEYQSISSLFSSLVNSGVVKQGSDEWYEWRDTLSSVKQSADDCTAAIENLYDKIWDIPIKQMEKVQKKYDNFISLWNDKITAKTNEIDEKNSAGRIVTSSDYNQLNSQYNQQIYSYTKEKEQLEKILNDGLKSGDIRSGSEQYYALSSAIADCSDNISQFTIKIQDNNDAIRDIPLDKIDKTIERLEHLSNVIDGMQSFHEAQGVALTSKEYYDQINNDFDLIKQNRDYISNVQASMKAGRYGVEGSEKWNEALADIEKHQETILSIMASQESAYDKIIDLQIDSLNKQKEALEKSNDELERQLSLEKAIEAFERAKFQKNKLVYHEGIGFVYEGDNDALREAQQDLNNEYYNKMLDDFDKAIEMLEELKKTNNIYNYSGTGIVANDKQLNKQFGSVGLKGYSEGGAVTYTGLAELHGGRAAEMVLNNSDVAKLYSYIHNTPNLLSDMIKNIGSIGNKSINSIIPKSANSTTISIGDIILKGVNNVETLSKAIINRLPTQLIQDLGK